MNYGLPYMGSKNRIAKWISREDFFKLKDTDPYVSLCFSFGNNANKGYCYSREIEPLKKALHYIICFNDFSLLKELNIQIDENLNGRLPICKAIKEFLNLNQLQLQHLERLERLQSLQSLEPLKEIKITNLDYRKVEIETDSVIYCDIPYKNTEKYSIGDFNHNEFYEWARKQNNIFISEYNMPNDFKIVNEKNIKSILCTASNRKTVTEKLYNYAI